MNFFDHQDMARRKTGLLLAYFVLAVALTMVAVDAVFYLMLVMLGALHPGDTLLWHGWSPQALLGTLIAVMTGCLVEYLRLGGGGTALASSIGARRIDFATRDLQERQFINVVEEMSIASGVPVPALYVMDREAGINAFVAGLSPDDTVMVVTGGALAAFTRDELQAVAGHEYSHILNGDMRLNMRLMMLLGGILVIGQLGSFLMRHAHVSGLARTRDRRGAPMMIVAGLLIWLVGAIGLFFGRVIKAAISRQREFLADASSVQFTRNPGGLAHALIRIRNQAEGSVLDNLHAEDMSHLCFGEALHFSRWLATHPPLDERIRVLGEEYLVLARVRQREQDRGLAAAQRLAAASGAGLPAGVSALVEPTGTAAAATTAARAGAAPASAEASGDLPPLEFRRTDPTPAPITPPAPATDAVRPAVQALPESMVARVGTVNPAELRCARQMHERLPASVVKALETPRGTEALLFALTAKQSGLPPLTVSTFMREQQSGLQADVMWIYQALGDLEMAHALPLVELALPRLQLLMPEEQRQLLGRLQAMARLDGHISTFEFALLMLLRKHLHLLPPVRQTRLAKCEESVSHLIAILLHAGGMRDDRLARTHTRLLRTLTSRTLPLVAPGATRFSRLATEMGQLAGLPLQDKRRVLELAATAVMADGKVELEEYELLRVVAALLDCPMPVMAI